MPLWGIDLGGTKIEGVILESPENPKVIIRERIGTEAEQGYEHIINNISLLVESLSNKTGLKPEKIGFGTPGSINPATGTMKNCNTTCLNDQDLKADLSKRLGIEVRIANDANCFAVSEANMGVIKKEMPQAKVVFGVIMGTGCGGGLVVNGQGINGINGIGGEWGHNFLDESGGPCYCGKSGCVEQVLSGPALERYYKQQAGQSKKMKLIYQSYLDQSDPMATKTIDRMIHFFGQAISVVINIVDPDAIVIGGGVGNIDLLYTKGVKEIEKHIFNPTVNTKFFKPALGDSAGVFGAAYLVADGSLTN